MFGKKNQLLQEAEATIRQQQEQLDKYKRHYEKQQGYIEGLYDVIGDMSRQLGAALQQENLERLQNNPYLEDNSNFFLDLHTLFSSRIKKGSNVTCYFGKDLVEIKRKFQDRDFKDSTLVHLTERFTIEDLRRIIKDWMWKKPLVEGLKAIRKEKELD
jgi:ClpP class serine protease